MVGSAGALGNGAGRSGGQARAGASTDESERASKPRGQESDQANLLPDFECWACRHVRGKGASSELKRAEVALGGQLGDRLLDGEGANGHARPR